MAMTAAATGGSDWVHIIDAAVKTVMPVTVGLIYGLPIRMQTRSIPTDKPVILAEATDGILLATFDSIPLETRGATTQNRLRCEYPNGTYVEVVCTQE